MIEMRVWQVVLDKFLFTYLCHTKGNCDSLEKKICLDTMHHLTLCSSYICSGEIVLHPRHFGYAFSSLTVLTGLSPYKKGWLMWALFLPTWGYRAFITLLIAAPSILPEFTLTMQHYTWKYVYMNVFQMYWKSVGDSGKLKEWNRPN
jgi:hypothetical protein